VKLESHKSFRQLIRYLLVGGFNTVFGYGLFALLNWSFTGLGSYSYMYAAVLANLIAITVAFLGYKWFVFRTRGNYFIEYIRCFAVYGTSALIGLAGLPILVETLRHYLHNPVQAPYIAAAIMTVVAVSFSFTGHKKFSFRHRTVNEDSKSGSEIPPA
jgi:putative flippase GtrA